LLLPLRGRRVLRVMHGSALAEALTARSPWRCFLQAGVYAQELLTAATQRYCVGVSANTGRWNPFVRKWVANGVDLATFFPRPEEKTRQPSILFVGALGGRKRGGLLLDWFTSRVRSQYPDATLDLICGSGPAMHGVSYYSGLTDN